MFYRLLEGMRFTHKIGIEVLIVAAAVFLMTVVCGKVIIPILRAKKANQPINQYVAEHASKAGTPTMGGICFIIASLVILLLWIALESKGIIGAVPKAGALIPFALTICLGVGNALIGFIDDYKKLIKKENEGLKAWQKFTLQTFLALAYLLMMGMTKNLTTVFHIPFSPLSFDLGIFAYPLYLVVIVGFVNSTNITDGLDGLASSIGVSVSIGIISLCILTFGGFAVFEPMYVRYTPVIAASLLGALMGFLVFNHYPAKVFMGDTGSLYIGGIVMGCAIAEGELFAVVIMSLVYICEMLSSLLQTLYYKLSGGKRIFKKAPVHHHFQMMGWSEIKIVTVFFITSVIFTVIGVLSVIL